MAEFGPHLLGRKPSPPDLRDYRLANFAGLGEQAGVVDVVQEAELAIAELQKTTITYKRWAATKYPDVTKTHWWQAFNHLANIAGSPPPVPENDKTWPVNFQLDQGNTGHCVGFGWAGWGDAEPIIDDYENADGHAIYYECKVIEGDPKGEDGAYVRDGATAMKNRNRLTTYAFANTIEDALLHLRTKGPLVVGTDWTNDMFTPDANGRVRPTGDVAGGHCYLLYEVSGTTLWFKNSWGSTFGVSGSFCMTIDDFQVLMNSYGELVASVELPL